LIGTRTTSSSSRNKLFLLHIVCLSSLHKYIVTCWLLVSIDFGVFSWGWYSCWSSFGGSFKVFTKIGDY
jgi:hypothetical protein